MSLISLPAMLFLFHLIWVNNENVPYASNAMLMVQNPQLSSSSGMMDEVFIREQKIQAVNAYPVAVMINEVITPRLP